MKKRSFTFSNTTVAYYFDADFAQVEKLAPKENAVIVTDEHVFAKHKKKFKGWNTIVLKAGEKYKVQQTVDVVIDQLIALGADRKTTLIGVGGGVVTDITGYVAGIYMRGIRFGFVPTSLLAMVDASIGGKNGIDVGVYKNMVGLIRQPAFLLFDTSFLATLPKAEWQNGFAEIIKHACIKDAVMFRQLQKHKLSDYQKNGKLLSALIEQNVLIKTKVVQGDEFEQGERKLLNFGHTLGHAIENMYELSHGQAISIGMTYAAVMSQQLKHFTGAELVVKVLEQYGLPTLAQFNTKKAFKVLMMDKKKDNVSINYILLEKIGKGVVQPLLLVQLQDIFKQFGK
ncbi:MAG: 3-dehydroquinate synthase [Chitinophagaceae bacterium]|nr:3-dehydroquinate synthase [Chitinophagaceae bacterium]MEA3427224.1 3-dehydroquinate synthase [Bacteroidota bacterium]MCA6452866.1 3-dehydroquinate synthase [Chitinophagaceae bacterium]MCA6454807.1 3-dehydroquinate synthase [Chitinophagaceae bacterium]MCA6459400.1 3-dehydroquinate synthase [Chitinophagaceae bacterium]